MATDVGPSGAAYRDAEYEYEKHRTPKLPSKSPQLSLSVPLFVSVPLCPCATVPLWFLPRPPPGSGMKAESDRGTDLQGKYRGVPRYGIGINSYRMS